MDFLQLNPETSSRFRIPGGVDASEDEKQLIAALVERFPDPGLDLRRAALPDLVLRCREVAIEIWHLPFHLWKADHFRDFRAAFLALALRRQAVVLHWVQVNVAKFEDDGEARLTLADAGRRTRMLVDSLRLCDASCSECMLQCMEPLGHETPHLCGGGCKCTERCHYCQEAPTPSGRHCHLPAGHTEPHDCGAESHTCGLPCSLSSKGNCGRTCTKKPGHAEAEHMCSAPFHRCSEPCSLRGCQGPCITPHGQVHTTHKCREIMCPERCSFEGCVNKCASEDHFHAEKCGPHDHICDQPHPCTEDCEAPGICEIIKELVSEVTTFQNAHGSFQYPLYTDQNGLRKKCCKEIPPGRRRHDGPHLHSLRENLQHYCETKCPSCS
uniref:Uncharacterized protein n=1 Tax=Chromera velia CCMP2878 TaxID=1169474 RepID=A0A0G4G8U6_9ALVE|eukprot:Cvel_4360.t1-p1 / transcript=Cvel_4360.t1 / gene=Cvel_4360 / organism=Chromera_velia_CCMP2878 / gene_product=NFX1-type zinc finger-containing protein 1, putative / transcript_product=NFX1-type zinc finger-containing protein 1, putative / location=Cvel_scaffold189:24041-25941(+) / protein_length=382 / sequence_SO=supercontig / SO=protein_coding / is_pseudo=false